MKRIVSLLMTYLTCLLSFSQITYLNGNYTTGKEQCARFTSFEIKSDGVIATIEVKALKKLKRLSIYSSDNTFIITGDPKKGSDIKLLKLSGVLVNGEIKSASAGWGWDKVPEGSTYSYQLFFKGEMPSGVTSVGVYDYGVYEYQRGNRSGYSFWNYKVNNPRKNYFEYANEAAAKQHIDIYNDGICGIYETINDDGAKLACVKSQDIYYLVYLSAPESYKYRSLWQLGDIKAVLRESASGIFKADWCNVLKGVGTMYVTFDGISMTAMNNKEEIKYLKMYPTAASSAIGSNTKQKQEWTGTGFALKNGYIVTNHHVIDGASSIVVQGVNGNSTEYKAEVVSIDKHNDLALIKINDYRFDGFGLIPYSIKETLCDVGADVFVLGYPMTTYMGEELKLTNGIISSRTGYQGDVTTYQISAPIQPGNSGGPMFDSNGNVVGVINAGIPGAENVGYAIKTLYLNNLINSSVSSAIIPKNNVVIGKSLSEKVKVLRNYVFYIKCK